MERELGGSMADTTSLEWRKQMASDSYDDTSLRLSEEDLELDSGLSREALVRNEFSGSVSILKSNDLKSQDQEPKRKCTYCVVIGVTVFIFWLGLIILLAGIILIAKKPKCEKSKYEAYTDMCKPTTEANSKGLYTFLHKVETFYYETFPNKIQYKRPVTIQEIRSKFKIYDESPYAKKKFTDRCAQLLQEMKSLNIDRKKLSVRESRALSQIAHVLKYGLGYTYSINYYTGDYMLLQNTWCFSVPLCDVGNDLGKGLRYLKPRSVKDMEMLRDSLKTVKAAFEQYVENLKYGVNAGMVPTIGACRAGANGLRSRYINIADHNDQGVFKEPFMKDILDERFLSNFAGNSSELVAWKAKYAKSANESLKEFVVNYVGKPIYNMFRYIRGEYLIHCVPNNISSGLSSLPLDYIYVNGTASTAKKTSKRLPSGEVLDGKLSYERLVGSFTTKNVTPEAIYQLGIKLNNDLQPKIVELAKEITGEVNTSSAMDALRRRLESFEFYYNNGSLPVNESDDMAYKQCSNENDAKKNCPVRWEAIERYFADAAMFNSLLDPKTVSMFFFTGPKYSVPNCPLAVVPDFNPSAAVPSYRASGPECTENSQFRVPFFDKDIGPKWFLLSFCVHEGRPGHHTQLQGYHERFLDTCGGVITWLDKLTLYWPFVEGWGVYAEHLVAMETDITKGRPFAKYGMLMGQINRAQRLILDAGFHYKGITASEAKKLYSAPDSAITRYQSVPGQAISYMIGQQHILKLRQRSKRELGSKFNTQDFHYHLLSQGNSPLSHFDEIIEQYVMCTKDRQKIGCDVILNPPVRPEEALKDEGVQGDVDYYYDPPRQQVANLYY